jgi:hypothetical protein
MAVVPALGTPAMKKSGSATASPPWVLGRSGLSGELKKEFPILLVGHFSTYSEKSRGGVLAAGGVGLPLMAESGGLG